MNNFTAIKTRKIKRNRWTFHFQENFIRHKDSFARKYQKTWKEILIESRNCFYIPANLYENKQGML